MKILIVENDQNIADLIKLVLTKSGYSSFVISSGSEAVDFLRKETPDLMILDYSLPDMQGNTLIHTLKSDGIRIPLFIVSTGHGSERIAVEMMKLGARDYVIKDKDLIKNIIDLVKKILGDIEKERKYKHTENAFRTATECIGILNGIKNLDIRLRRTVKTLLKEMNVSRVYIFQNGYDYLSQIPQENEMYMTQIYEECASGIESQMGNTSLKKLYYKDAAEDLFLILSSGNSYSRIVSEMSPKDRELLEEQGIKSVLLLPIFTENYFWGFLGFDDCITDRTWNYNDLMLLQMVSSSIGMAIKRSDTERSLVASELKYRTLIENQGEGIAEFDRDQRFVFANKAAERIFDVEDGELLGTSIYDFVVPELINSLEEDIRDKWVAGKYSSEIEIKTKKNKSVHLLITTNPQTNERGEFLGTFAILRDISERKSYEDQLLKLSLLVMQSPASIMITDLNGRIEYINTKFTKVTGFEYDEIIGKNANILNGGTKSKKEYRELWETITNGREWRGEFFNRKKDGTMFWESALISPIKNKKGDVVNFVAIKEDITEKKSLEIELNYALNKAEESDKMKSALLLNMSHEFRTPMTGILGMSNLLKEIIQESDKQEILDMIYKSGKRLMNTLDSVLEIAELETGNGIYENEKINLHGITHKIVEELKWEANLKGLEMHFEVTDKNLLINISEKNISIILRRLIDNAIKFTREGSITVNVCRETTAQGLFAKIMVEDTGIGISKQYHSVIFDEFRQVSEGTGRSHEGPGLGLPLVKKVVELAKGRVGVESEVGKGSVFSVLLPATISLETEKDDVTEETKKRSRRRRRPPLVLLVEDNVINKIAVVNYLNGICNTKYVSTGEDAIRIVREKKFDLILMDINLGAGIDGIQATKEIRKLKGYNKTPIVAVTGYCSEKDRRVFRKEGFTHFIPKPFEKEEMADLVKQILNL